MSTPESKVVAPLRLFLIYDEDSEMAKSFADYFYDWFRTKDLLGPPVYVRTRPEDLIPTPGDDPKEDSKETTAPVPTRKIAEGELETLEYFIPLIDVEMTSNPAWHDALVGLAEGVYSSKPQADKKNGHVPDLDGGAEIFPVGLHPTAINVPAEIANRNSIRYNGPDWQDTLNPAVKSAFDDILKHLTEAFVRNLNLRLFPTHQSPETQVFISYARADKPDIPKAVRNYIQSSTQCDAFLDENDIAFGSLFAEVLKSSTNTSSALIAVWSDHYPFRPWCRFEVENFTKPREPHKGSGSDDNSPETEFLKQVRYIPPMVVLDTQKGRRTSRVLPEFARATCVRYGEDRKDQEMIVFMTLMREAFWGLVGYREALLYAKTNQQDPNASNTICINTLPRPEVVHHLLDDPAKILRFPGRGPAPAEAKLLANRFLRPEGSPEADRIAPFRADRTFEIKGRDREKKFEPCIWLSAGNTSEFPKLGYHHEHRRELFIKMLRPLVQAGLSLIYGGNLPDESVFSPLEAGKHINWTHTFLEIITRDSDDMGVVSYFGASPSKKSPPGVLPRPRLFLPVSWPDSVGISSSRKAEWIPVASVIDDECDLFNLAQALNCQQTNSHFGFGEDAPYPTLAKLKSKKSANWSLWRDYHALSAMALQNNRRRIANGFECRVPKEGVIKIKPVCIIMIGGKTDDFTGLAPGIFEEFYYATENKIPVFLLGGYGGAAGQLAKILLQKPSERKMPESDEYRRIPPKKDFDHPGKSKYVLTEERLKPVDKYDDVLAMLSQKLESSTVSDLLNNGLNDYDSEKLLKCTNINETVNLVWQGMKAIGI